MATIIGTNGNDVREGTINTDFIFGLDGDDRLLGLGGDDVLIGGAGADELIGGAGVNSASYQDAASGVIADLLFPNANTGDAAGDRYELIQNLTGSDLDDHLGGDYGANVLIGGTGNDFLAGRGGNDELFGGAGNDRLSGDVGEDRLSGGIGFDMADYSGAASAVYLDLDTGGTLGVAKGDLYDSIEAVTGSNFGDGLRGSAVSDQIFGLDGDDILVGKAGDDELLGGEGDDRLLGGAGADRLIGGFDFDIVDYTDATSGVNLDLDTGGTLGEAAGDTYDSIDGAVGSKFADVLRGRAEGDRIFGLRGDDLIFGEAGHDTLFGEDGEDVLNGDTGDDTLLGGFGSDSLNGGEGWDIMRGGPGNDLYFVDSIKDLVDEAAAGSDGSDTIVASVNLSLANPTAVLGAVEYLSFTGTADLNGTGNDLDNRIVGNDGANILEGGGGYDQLLGGAGKDHLSGGRDSDFLDGGAGADVMQGGTGHDSYVVDNAGDVVDETTLGAGGFDTIVASVSFSLANTAAVRGKVEGLRLADGNANLNGAGNELDNELFGNGGNNILGGGGGNDWLSSDLGDDRLDGGDGADLMVGGAGNDVYVVDNAGDTVNESSAPVELAVTDAGGVDTVASTISFSLASSARVLGTLENLTLLGSASINAAGNSLNNVLTGNAGGNVLNAGAGADTMRGGAGNDIYVVDNTGDKIDESLAGSNGSDAVQSSISFSLANTARVSGAVENLVLLGSANINATGNALNNVLTGNAGANVLNGGAGVDNLRGGAGNDIYVVDNAGDIVNESLAGSNGTDTVQSTISFSLANAARVLGTVENLTLLGSTNVSATGNSRNNMLTGNSGANVLNGGAGADTMHGGAGNDTYVVDNVADVANESLAGSNGADTVMSSISFSLANTARVFGAVENLKLLGSANTSAIGNSGNNGLTGNAGANVLNGGAGNDVLNGGAGKDTLTGGAGLDRFVFNTVLNASTNVDRITDFSVPSDTILLDNAVMAGLGVTLGTLSSEKFFKSTTGVAHDANDRIIYETDTGKLFYDANGSAAGGSVHVATLGTNLAITNADFVVI